VRRLPALPADRPARGGGGGALPSRLPGAGAGPQDLHLGRGDPGAPQGGPGVPFRGAGAGLRRRQRRDPSGEAANALLKNLEEPHTSAPRHFFLLAPSRLDLLPTLRSRSLAVFLGPAEPLDGESLEPLARSFAAALEAYAGSGAPIYLLTAAEALSKAGGWEDPRSGRPWAVAASAVLRSLDLAPGAGGRRGRLALAEALLEGPSMRLRSVSADRILEGLVAKYLASGTGI
jgi:hypothetical protein